MTVVVIGGTVQQAKQYCQKAGLGYGDAVIVNSATQLYGRHRPKVTVVGTYDERPDWPERSRNAEVNYIFGEVG